jgi:hypothetical protein
LFPGFFLDFPGVVVGDDRHFTWIVWNGK